MINEEASIQVSSLSKSFKLPHEKHSSLKGMFVSAFRGKRTYERQQVLSNISFEIKKGEFFGIVGRNGSGKSTLLKLLAGIYSPDKGRVQVNGKLTPFIELGVGFNPELTGRENIYLNGALLGFNRSEMSAMYDEIVTFAELEKFMDQKLKNYSSGMQVRLAFSIAIRVETEIMLIDEVLAVGDEAFQRKCFRFFREVKHSGRTIILVSHDMSAIRDFCDRAMLVHNGELIMVGEPKEVAEQYSKLNMEQTDKDLAQPKTDLIKTGTGEAKILSIKTLGESGKAKNTFKPKGRIRIEVIGEALDNLEAPTVGVVIEDARRNPIFATNTPTLKVDIQDMVAGQKVYATFEVDNIFTDGEYSVSCAISSKKSKTPFVRLERAHDFFISGWEMKASLTHPGTRVTIKH